MITYHPLTTYSDAPRQPSATPTADLRAQLTAIWRDARPAFTPPWLAISRVAHLPQLVQENTAPAYRSDRPLIQAYALGEATVRCNGRIVEDSLWHTTKNKSLFFCLLSHPHGVSEDAILEEFWPNCLETGKQNLYAATSKLRHMFRALSKSEHRFIVRRQGRLLWENGLPLWYDLQEVRRQATLLPGTNSLSPYQRLVELIRGTFLPECEHFWAQTVRTEINLLWLNALTFLSRHFLQLNQATQALEYAQQLARQFPLEQQGCELNMRAWLSLGHSTRALECYNTFCAELRRELNAEPTLDLLTLYQQAKMGVRG